MMILSWLLLLKWYRHMNIKNLDDSPHSPPSSWSDNVFGNTSAYSLKADVAYGLFHISGKTHNWVPDWYAFCYSFAVCMLVDLQDVTGNCSKATRLLVCLIISVSAVMVDDSDIAKLFADMMLLLWCRLLVDADIEVGRTNDVCDLLIADDTKVDILRALALLAELPHGKDVAIHSVWTAYFICIVEQRLAATSPNHRRSSFHRQI